MQNVFEVIASIIISLVFLVLVLWGLSILFRKYVGATLTTRAGYKSTVRINEMAHQDNLKQLSKYDSEIIAKARKNLAAKLYANTSDNLLIEIEKIIEKEGYFPKSKKIRELEDNLLAPQEEKIKFKDAIRSSDVVQIMQSRTLLKKNLERKQCYLKIDKIANEKPYLINGKQVHDVFDSNKEVMKREIYCCSNSELEMEKNEIQEILRQGFIP